MKIFKILLINLFIFIFLGELVMRFYSPIPDANLVYGTSEVDPKIGWVSKANYQADREAQDMLGNTYPVNYHTEKHGFKAYGDPNSEKPKLLFLGDSFIQSVEVSNDKCFYNLVKDSLDVEVFAYGAAGYGQYQQYLILDKYYEEIQPDIIIWQTCSNDFIDNHFDLMTQCGYRVNELRPYLNTEGKVIYRSPTANNLIYYLKTNSAFYYNLDLLANFSAKGTNLKTDGEYYMSHEGLKFPPFKESIDITNMILDKAVARVDGQSKFVGISTFSYEPMNKIMRELMVDHGFTFMDEVHQYATKAHYGKENINSSDTYHWNEKGHALISKAILDGFERHDILAKP